MEQKILQFDKDVNRYVKLADACSDKEDYVGALKYLTSAKSIDENNLDVLVHLADVYADMGLMELSNKYWFEYMDKAPKSKVAVAYEELAINYFYLDNFWSSSYYFHQKLDVDGFISKEGLSQEIIDFFSGEELKKSAYRIAYPFSRADYTFEAKKAKHLITVGAFEEGAKVLERIPEQCLDEECAGELATCYFMSDRLDEAESVCRASLERHGENITAFCNLSTVYDMKEDFDNSDFYYKKALAIRKGDLTESYKIATCAIEREDHKVIKQCLEEILKDRPYEFTMRFFYALALANLSDFSSAYEQLKFAHIIEPNDLAIKFHLSYVKGMVDGGGDMLNLVPFKYVKDIPEDVAKAWRKKICQLAKTPEKFTSAIKKKEWQEILEWGLRSDESEVMRNCAYILSETNAKVAKDMVFKTLLSPDGGEELKRVLIYVTIVSGVKQAFGVVASTFYAKIKPRRVLCEKDKVWGGLYFSAYALCMSKMAFFNLASTDKMSKACDKIYKKLKGIITDSDATNEEIAALILSECNYEKYSDENSVMKFFSINKEKLTSLKNLLKGEQND